ncbi:MAG: protein kinase domain-containing protein [Gemmataceae bacterium]
MTAASLCCPHCQAACQPATPASGGEFVCPHCRKAFLAPPLEEASSKRSSPWWWLSEEPSASSLPATRPWDRQPDAETVGLWKPGDVILELYEVREVFTSGGRGLVYRVHHRGWNMDLAVKCPRTEFFQSEQDKADFEREAETWVKLGLHPHLATCHYVRRLGGIPRVFAEYVSGGSLAEWIRSQRLYAGGPTRALERVLDIAIQFAWGLQHAHEQGLVHRDVKPGNVLMTSDGIAKVTDFGMAKERSVADPSAGRSSFTSATDPNVSSADAQLPAGGTILVSAGGLTPAFCSPEQVQGRPVSRKTDIWSWGVSLLHMFTGSAFWSAGYLAAGVLDDYLKRGPPHAGLPAMPPALAELLKQCFRSNPDERPRDMLEIAAALQRLHSQALGRTYRRPPPQAAKARADALNNRALSLQDLNKLDQAEQLWQEALTISPQHPESTYNLGLTHWRSGRLTTERLRQQLHDAGIAHPDEWLPSYLLARMQLEEGEWRSCLQTLERVPASGAELDEVRSARESAQECLKESGRLVRRFTGHTGWVSSVCAGRNGRSALSGGADGTLKLWSALSGRCLRTFEGHAEWVTSVGLSADGRLALSGSADRTLRLWRTDDGHCLHVLAGHDNWVLAAALRGDGRIALSGSGDGTVKLWDTESGLCLRTLDGHEGPVLSVFISGAGRHVLTGSRDRTLLLWNAESGQRLRAFSGHTDKVLAAALSGDGCHALSGSGDRTLRLWDAATGRCLRVFEGHQGSVTSVCFSSGGGYVLSGSEDRTIKIWQRNTGRCLATLEGHAGTVHSICVLARGGGDGSGRQQVLSASADGTLALWTLPRDQLAPYVLSRVLPSDTAMSAWTDYERSLKRARQALAASKSARAAHYLREARSQLGHGRRPEAMSLWSNLYVHLPRQSLQGAWGAAILADHTEAVTSVCLSSDGRLALSGSSDRTLKLWEPSEARCLHTLEGDMGGVTSTALSGDGRLALSASTDAALKLWDVRTGDCLRTCREDLDVLTSVALSGDARLAVSASVDGTVHLWDVSAGRLLRVLGGHSGPVHSVALSSDGRLALSGSAVFIVRNDGERLFTSGQLKVWDTATGRCLPLFEDQSEAVTAVSLSADGRLALTGCGQAVIQRDNGRFVQSGMVHLWELATARRLCTFEGHSGAVTSVCLSFDGRHALSGSTDATVKLWEIASGQCLRTFAGHADAVTSVAFSADGRFALSGSADRGMRVWILDWELADAAPADWDEGAGPYLEMFLSQHTPYAVSPERKRNRSPLARLFQSAPADKEITLSLTRQGPPRWTENDFHNLLRTLGYAGFGWLRPEGVRRELTRRARRWREPFLLGK